MVTAEPSKLRFRFVEWVDPATKKWAKFIVYPTLEVMVVPRSRLIPHQDCQNAVEYRGIRDPNRIAELCAEESSLFGLALYRHYLHLKKKGDLMSMDLEERGKTFYFHPELDFSCVRDMILRGESTKKALIYCVGIKKEIPAYA